MSGVSQILPALTFFFFPTYFLNFILWNHTLDFPAKYLAY